MKKQNSEGRLIKRSFHKKSGSNLNLRPINGPISKPSMLANKSVAILSNSMAHPSKFPELSRTPTKTPTILGSSYSSQSFELLLPRKLSYTRGSTQSLAPPSKTLKPNKLSSIEVNVRNKIVNLSQAVTKVPEKLKSQG